MLKLFKKRLNFFPLKPLSFKIVGETSHMIKHFMKFFFKFLVFFPLFSLLNF